ncbi:hypothetical protein E3N88_45108 [Mikania micrantha]|uniref:Uncharacterized protein n=1 Tax=Mikania micrantha TaxID=192012 RepID=A0A5N6LA52_9ASTR|nr:hypothetical protein E3N88_45108 [Mikania micrantha]
MRTKKDARRLPSGFVDDPSKINDKDPIFFFSTRKPGENDEQVEDDEAGSKSKGTEIPERTPDTKHEMIPKKKRKLLVEEEIGNKKPKSEVEKDDTQSEGVNKVSTTRGRKNPDKSKQRFKSVSSRKNYINISSTSVRQRGRIASHVLTKFSNSIDKPIVLDSGKSLDKAENKVKDAGLVKKLGKDDRKIIADEPTNQIKEVLDQLHEAEEGVSSIHMKKFNEGI